jgi:hypothetical protein
MGPQTFPWPLKIGGHKMAKSGRKDAGKYFYNYVDENPYNYLEFL